jgi:FOG: GAF domain
MSSLDAAEACDQLVDVMARRTSFEETATEALDIGSRCLEVDHAVVTRVDPAADHWEAVVSTDPPDGPFPAGRTFDLKRTFCRRVVDRDGAVAIHHAATQGLADDPAHQTTGLDCYYGLPLRVGDDLYGTLCFADETPRDRPFDDPTTTLAGVVARLLEAEIERVDRERELERYGR